MTNQTDQQESSAPNHDLQNEDFRRSLKLLNERAGFIIERSCYSYQSGWPDLSEIGRQYLDEAQRELREIMPRIQDNLLWEFFGEQLHQLNATSKVGSKLLELVARAVSVTVPQSSKDFEDLTQKLNEEDFVLFGTPQFEEIATEAKEIARQAHLTKSSIDIQVDSYVMI